MHPALIALQVAGGMLALAIDAEPITGGRWTRAEPGPLVADVGPDPRRPGAALARRLELDKGVVGEDRRTAQDMTADRLSQWLQQRRRLADPAGQRGAVQIDAFALEDLRLLVQR